MRHVMSRRRIAGRVTAVLPLLLGSASAMSQTWTATVESAAIEPRRRPESQVTGIATTSGGLLLVGMRSQLLVYDPPCENLFKETAWAMQIDASGSIEWQHEYPRTEGSRLVTACRAPDGGYLAGGHLKRPGTGPFCLTGIDTDPWLAKLRSDGTIQWQVRWTAPSRCFASNDGILSIAAHPDGGCLVAGRTCDLTGGPGHALLLARLDATGALMWQRTRDVGTNIDWPVTAVALPAGGFAVATRIRSADGTQGWGWVHVVDDGGNVSWSRLYRDSSTLVTGFTAVDALPDGSLVVAGDRRQDDLGTDLLVARLDAAGDVAWAQALGGLGYPRSDPDDGDKATRVVVLPTGNILVVGLAESVTPGVVDTWTLLFDPASLMLWQRHHRPPGTLRMLWTSGDLASDGGFVLAAAYYDAISWAAIWMAKTDARGLVTDSCPDRADVVLPSGMVSLVVSPGPPVEMPLVGTFEAADAVASPLGLVLTPGCAPSTCVTLDCAGAQFEPPLGCPGSMRTLTASIVGGEGPITVEWDFDGDTLVDATGTSINVALPEGTTSVTYTAIDSCADSVPQTCQASVDVPVFPAPSPVITPAGPLAFCAAAGASVILDAGAGFASYQWTLDGADIAGATTTTHAAVASGAHAVRVVDANGCTGTSAAVVVDADDCPVPGEVSDVRAGERPLLMSRASSDVRVELEPDATAYNAYIGRMGSWFVPENVAPAACHVTTWTDNGDGTVTFAQDVPPGSWLLVTASAAGGEGLPGRDSSDADRRARGTWTECGAYR